MHHIKIDECLLSYYFLFQKMYVHIKYQLCIKKNSYV